MSPGDELFTDADLEPTAEERRAVWRRRLDLASSLIGLGAIALWAGTIAAVRWCAIPALGATLPAALGSTLLAAIHSRADGIGIGCGAVLLGSEVGRLFVQAEARRAVGPRLRRLVAIFAAGAAAYLGLGLSPARDRAAQGGGPQGFGPQGSEAALLARRSEQLRLGELVLLGLLLGLQLATARGRPDRDQQEPEAEAPLPPGPRSKAPS
jgi:hypothetical protein